MYISWLNEGDKEKKFKKREKINTTDSNGEVKKNRKL